MKLLCPSGERVQSDKRAGPVRLFVFEKITVWHFYINALCIIVFLLSLDVFAVNIPVFPVCFTCIYSCFTPRFPALACLPVSSPPLLVSSLLFFWVFYTHLCPDPYALSLPGALAACAPTENKNCGCIYVLYTLYCAKY